jgi:hypothetical protein
VNLDERLDQLDVAIAQSDRTAAIEHARASLAAAFEDGVHGWTRPWLPRELDDRQRRILRALVAIASLPRHGDDPVFPLDVTEACAVGVFDNTPAVQRLAGDVHGPLDREIVLSGRPMPMWFAIHEVVGARAPMDALREAFESIAAIEGIAIIEDAIAGPFALHHSRERRDYPGPAAYELENAYASRFIGVLASLLGEMGPIGVAHARTMIEPQRDIIPSLIAAWVLGVDALANSEEPPGELERLVHASRVGPERYHQALHAVLRMLPSERRTALLDDERLYASHPSRPWQNRDGWRYLDLLEPAARVEKILDAWRAWKRHRTNHVNVADEAFPFDRAIEILEDCEDAGAAALAELRGS